MGDMSAAARAAVNDRADDISAFIDLSVHIRDRLWRAKSPRGWAGLRFVQHLTLGYEKRKRNIFGFNCEQTKIHLDQNRMICWTTGCSCWLNMQNNYWVQHWTALREHSVSASLQKHFHHSGSTWPQHCSSSELKKTKTKLKMYESYFFPRVLNAVARWLLAQTSSQTGYAL